MSEWTVRSLGELCDDLTVGHVGSMASEYVVSGIPFLRSQNVKRGYLDLNTLKYISSAFHQKLKKSQLLPGDIVIVRTGEPGAAALIPDGIGDLNCSDLVIARPGTNVDPRFLCYSINSTAEAYISAHLVGAVQQHFNVGSARNLQISVPSLSEQRAIAEVLEALDDKIAVNNKITRTASDLVQARYLEASLNPSHVMLLGELIELRYGRSLPAPERVEGEFPVYGSGGVTGTHDRYLVTGPGIVVGRKGTVGTVYWSEKDFFPIDTTFYVKLRREDVPKEFVFHVLKNLGLNSMNSDSAVPGLSRSNALALQVRVPDQIDLERYRGHVRPLFELREHLSIESASLTELRETLLPKLVSGEIRVRDAEKVVEDVT